MTSLPKVKSHRSVSLQQSSHRSILPATLNSHKSLLAARILTRSRSKRKLQPSQLTSNTAEDKIRKILKVFQSQQDTRDPKASLTLNKLRLHHPLLSQLSQNAFKYLVDNSFLGTLKPRKPLYLIGQKTQPYFYVILYGQLSCQKANGDPFGSLMCIGHTLGEETLFQKQKYRTETVTAVTECCVLQVDSVNFSLMAIEKHVGAGGSSLVDDYNLLVQIL